MGGGWSGGSGMRSLPRLLLMLVLALVGVEYMFGSMMQTHTGNLRAYLYTQTQASREPQTTLDTRADNSWLQFQNVAVPGPLSPKRTQSRPTSSDGSELDYQIVNTIVFNIENSKRNSDVKSDNLKSVLITKLNNAVNKNEKLTKGEVTLPPCSPNLSELGPISANKTKLSIETVEMQYPRVRLGGRYSPPNCTPAHKVAIIVPYRDRAEHLAIFLNNLHPMLIKQQLDYGIFVVEQKGDLTFNKGKLMNLAYIESQKARPGGWDCFVFHDVDLIPLDSRNIYSCPELPRHMSAAVDTFHFGLPYYDLFGGVVAMTAAHFKAVNGFSNKYWGWGGEDDDMSCRIRNTKNLSIVRYNMSIARYTMLRHPSRYPKANPKRWDLLNQTLKVFQQDGLSSLEYQIVNITKHHLYTSVLADVEDHSYWEYVAKFQFWQWPMKDKLKNIFVRYF